MRNTLRVLTLAAAATAAASAQRFEFGAQGLASFYTDKTVTGRAVGTSPTQGVAGFDKGWGASVYLGQNVGNIFGGEFRYDYIKNDLQLSSGSTKVNFGAQAHAVHYDVLLHFAPRNSVVRPFVVAGGGMKGYQGTGTETAVQPLSNLAYLTKTTQWKPMFTFGAGVKVNLSKKAQFRAEFRDQMTPFPTEIIALAPGASGLDGWIHNYAFLVGIAVLF